MRNQSGHGKHRSPQRKNRMWSSLTSWCWSTTKATRKPAYRQSSEIDEKGKAKTVPVNKKNENSFLKFDKNSSILENFIKNFWSQFKEPTHLRLIRMTIHDYKQNKEAIKDLSQGKETDAVKESSNATKPTERKQEGTE